MANRSGSQSEHHVIVKKSHRSVYLSLDGIEYRLSPVLARQVGDALYKAGCDVQAQLDEPKEKR